MQEIEMEVEEDAEAEKEDLKAREVRKKVYCTLYSVTFVHIVHTIILEYAVKTSYIHTTTPSVLFRQTHFLNQARAGRRPARAWFLKITSVRMYVCVCVDVCVCPPPGLLKTIHVK